MTPAILSALRHALTALGGYAVAKGWIPADGVEPIVVGLIALAGAVVSIYQAKKKEPQQ